MAAVVAELAVGVAGEDFAAVAAEELEIVADHGVLLGLRVNGVQLFDSGSHSD